MDRLLTMGFMSWIPEIRKVVHVVLSLGLGLATAGAASLAPQTDGEHPPNVVIVVADDLGYGDLGSYGHPTIVTPNLDRLAAEGQKWTSFYAAANVCTPSRAALLTGRWPVRSGMISDRRWVLTGRAAGGLPDSEITIAEILRTRGYRTGAIGKWHLGQQPAFLPTRQGFDEFFGTPFSNDEIVSPEWRRSFARRDFWNAPLFYDPRSEYWDIPLLRQEEEIERPVDQRTLTKRTTEAAVDFIGRHRHEPFFLYVAYHMPHVPLFASDAFRGRSAAGIYGDAVEEVDAGVGAIVSALEAHGLSRDTLVVFTSDNGPWPAFREHGGSAGPLRSGKGTTWEGGNRVPGIFWWPGRISPRSVNEMGAQLDLLPTIAALTGAALPEDRPIDGVDLRPVLLNGEPSPRRVMLYFRGTSVYAIREGAYKAHLTTQPAFELDQTVTQHEPPLLYHLGHDPGERHDLAAQHPEVVSQLLDTLAGERERLTYGEDQLFPQLPRDVHP